MLPVIAINLFIGFTIPFIDNGAHIGGLLTGMALTLLIPYVAPGEERRVSRAGLLLLTLCAGLVAASFAQAWRTSGPHLAWSSKAVGGYLDGINAAERAIVRGLRAGTADEASAREAGEAFALLDKSRPPDAEAGEIARELQGLLRRMQTPGADLTPLAREFEATRARLDKWVREVGVQHGIGPSEEAPGKD